MTTDEEMPTVPRGLVGSGAAVAALLGVAAIVLRVANATPGQGPAQLLGGVALAGLFVVPAGLAVHAVRARRRTALLGATVLVVIGSVPLFTLAPVALVVVVLWLLAWSRWPAEESRARPVLAPLLLAAVAGTGAVASLFVHVDPYCWERLSGNHGEVVTRSVPPDGPAGFRWQVDGSATGSEIAVNDDVLAAGCSSDRVTPGEALASLVFTGAAAGAVTRAAARAAP